MKDMRNLAAVGGGLLVTAFYLAALGVLDSLTNASASFDEALGYGVAVFVAATAGSWLLLGLRRDGPG